MTAAEQATKARREPYVIKADEREERYARGWYVIGNAASVTFLPWLLSVRLRRCGRGLRGRERVTGGGLDSPPPGRLEVVDPAVFINTPGSSIR